MDHAQATPGPTDFDFATEVAGSGRHYRAEIYPEWDGPITPHGGILQAIALKAITMELGGDSALQARSLTCHYLRPPTHGEIDIFVDPLRRGRRFASSRATISQAGKPCVSVLATHSSRDLKEIAHWAVPPPQVAPPPSADAPAVGVDELLQIGAEAWLTLPEGTPRVFDRFRFAPRLGAKPFAAETVDPTRGTHNGGWIQAFGETRVTSEWIAFLVDALWPSVLQVLDAPAMAPTLDLTTHIRADIPPGGLENQPLLLRNVTRSAQAGFSDSDSFVYSADGQLLAQSRQFQLLQPFEA